MESLALPGCVRGGGSHGGGLNQHPGIEWKRGLRTFSRSCDVQAFMPEVTLSGKALGRVAGTEQPRTLERALRGLFPVAHLRCDRFPVSGIKGGKVSER